MQLKFQTRFATSRSVDGWAAVIKQHADRIPAEQLDGALAQRLIGDLLGYKHSSKQRDADIEQITNFLTALASHNLTLES